MQADDEGTGKTFGLSRPTDMLEKLRWECVLLSDLTSKDNLNSRFAAFNACGTAWHLIEWSWYALSEAMRKRHNWSSEAQMRAALVAKCPELLLCQQIGNGGKHRRLVRTNDPSVRALHTIKIKVTQRDNVWIKTEPAGHQLNVFTPNGIRPIADVLASALAFWERQIVEWNDDWIA